MDDNTYQRLNRTLLSIQNDITNEEEKEQQIGENNNNTDGSEHHTEDPYDILNLKALLKLFGPAFARRIDFWYSVFFAILFGTICGGVGLGFFNGFEYISSHTWNTKEYQENIKNNNGGNYGQGEWDTMITMIIGGTAIGLIKVIWTGLFGEFPEDPPSLVTEVKDLHVHDPKLSIGLLLCSVISLGVGASVGPEAAAGAIGASLGTFIASLTCVSKRMESSNYFLPFLGISAAFGPLLPSPILSSILLHELTIASGAINRFDFMHSMVLSGIAASVSYTIFISLEDFTFLDQKILPIALFQFPNVHETDPILMLYAIPLGIVSGIWGFFGVLVLGICKGVGGAISKGFNNLGRKCCGFNSYVLGLFFTPIIGGVLLGIIAKHFPLTIGDGNAQMGAVMSQTFNRTIHREINHKLNRTHFVDYGALAVSDLIATSLMKIVALGISLGFGYIGGQLFPLMFSGTCLGAAASLLVGNDSLPIPIAVACCLVSIPCAFTPLVFTLTCTISMMLALGSAATAPIFVSAFVSYTTVCGFGTVQKLIAKGIERKGGELENLS